MKLKQKYTQLSEETNKLKDNAAKLKNDVTQFRNDRDQLTQQVNILSSSNRHLTTKAAVENNKALMLLELVTTSTKEGLY